MIKFDSMPHPARQIPYADLYVALEQEVENGNVTVKSHGDLRLYSYTEECAFKKKWNEINLMARGLILDVMAETVIATPFTKFFNYGEGCFFGQPMEPIPDEPFTVTDKVDGSLGIIYFHNGDWHVATRGSFTSEQAQWADDYLHQYDLSHLTPGVTYLTEIVFPSNRIVIDYDFSGLVLLASFDILGCELHTDAIGRIAPFRPVTRITGQSLDDLLVYAKSLPATSEGFVVRFQNGRRLKIKGDEYCRLHKLISRVTPLGVYDLMVAGDDLDAACAQLPEEFQRDFNAIRGLLTPKMEGFLQKIVEATEATKHLSDKDLGLWLKDQTTIAPEVARWIFPSRKSDFIAKALTPGSAGIEFRQKAFQCFRPTNNRLDGYRSSTAMNRFAEAAI